MRAALVSLVVLAVLSAAAVGTADGQVSGTERLTLRIEGMHCGACAERIEDTVGRLEGVVSADVNFEQTRAVVVYNPRRISPPRIIAAIEDAEFRAHAVP
jgi:copper chaperone CopZ